MKIKFIFFLFFIPTLLLSQQNFLYPARENNQYGYINNETKELEIPYQFDVAGQFKDGKAMVKKEGLWGVIKEDGSFILPIEYLVIAGPQKINEYAEMNYLQHNIFVKKGKKWGVFDNDFKPMIPIIYDDIIFLKEGTPFGKSNHFSFNRVKQTNKVFAVKLEGKWGVINESSKNIFPFKYDNIELVTNYDVTNINNNPSFHGNNRKKIYDQEGCTELVTSKKINPSYLLEQNGITTILQDNKTITISEVGLHDAVFCYALKDNSFKELFIMKKDNKLGIIDINGNIVLPFEYDNPVFLTSEYFQISKEKKIAIIDMNGEVIQPPTFDKVDNNTITLDGKCGTLTHDFKKYLITPQYDELQPFYKGKRYPRYGVMEKGALFASKDGQYGVIDSLNNIIIPFQNGKLSLFDLEIIIADFDGKKTILDLKGNPLLPQEIEFIKRTSQSKEELIVRKDGLVGIYNYKSNTFIINPIYQTIHSPYGKKYFYVVQKDDKFGLVKKDGSPLLPIEYDKISGHQIQKNNLYGYLDKFGKVLIEPKYERVQDQFAVKENGLWGILDSVGNWFVAPQFERIQHFYKGYIVFKKNKRGYINPSKNVFIQPIYDDIQRFTGRIKVKKNGFWSVMDDTGKVILPFEFTEIKSHSLNRLVVKKDSTWGIYSGEGKELQPTIFSEIGGNEEPYEYIPVFQNKKMGWVDEKGDLIIPCKYEDIRSNKRFSFQKSPHSIFPVKKNNKWGYVDGNGKEIIPFIYNRADPFFEGTAIVCLDGMMHVIDSTNQKITQIGYENIDLNVMDTIYRVKNNGKYGIIDNKGKTLVPTTYDLLDYKGILRGFLAKKNNKYGGITRDGEINFPLIFKEELIGYELGILKLLDSNPVLTNGKKLFPTDRKFEKEFFQEYYLTKKGDKIGITNIVDNSTLIPHEYDYITNFSNCELKYFKVKKGGKHGMVDKNNNIILPIEYDGIHGNPEYNILFVNKNGITTVHDFKGKLIIDDEFELSIGVSIFEPFGVRKNEKWGYIDRNGKTVIPFIYDRVLGFVQKDKSGNVKSIFHSNYLKDCRSSAEKDSLEIFSMVTIDGNNFVINEKGGNQNMLANDPNRIGDGFIKFTEDGKLWGVKNSKDKIVLPLDYLNIYSCQNDFISFQRQDSQEGFYFLKNKKFAFYDRVQQRAGDFSAIRWVEKDGLYGCINNEGELVTPMEYQRFLTASEGMRGVGKEDKIGFINREGKLVVTPKFESNKIDLSLYQFKSGFSIATKNGKFGFINRSGEIVAPIENDAISYFDKGVAVVSKNGKWKKIKLEN